MNRELGYIVKYHVWRTTITKCQLAVDVHSLPGTKPITEQIWIHVSARFEGPKREKHSLFGDCTGSLGITLLANLHIDWVERIFLPHTRYDYVTADVECSILWERVVPLEVYPKPFTVVVHSDTVDVRLRHRRNPVVDMRATNIVSQWVWRHSRERNEWTPLVEGWDEECSDREERHIWCLRRH